MVAYLHARLDDEALFRNPRGVFDHLASGDALLALNGDAAVVLDGGDFEFHPFLAILDKRFDLIRLNGGRFGAGIDAGFDSWNAQFLASAPFDTSDDVHVALLKKTGKCRVSLSICDKITISSCLHFFDPPLRRVA